VAATGEVDNRGFAPALAARRIPQVVSRPGGDIYLCRAQDSRFESAGESLLQQSELPAGKRSFHAILLALMTTSYIIFNHPLNIQKM
jgi:hypothetical protein